MITPYLLINGDISIPSICVSTHLFRVNLVFTNTKMVLSFTLNRCLLQSCDDYTPFWCCSNAQGVETILQIRKLHWQCFGSATKYNQLAFLMKNKIGPTLPLGSKLALNCLNSHYLAASYCPMQCRPKIRHFWCTVCPRERFQTIQTT